MAGMQRLDNPTLKRRASMALEPGDDTSIATAAALLAWYDCRRRDLPWRAKPGERADPYNVWLSEIMLQQTTVAAVKPYFAAFVARWPSVDRLAAAKPAEVLQLWAGLGYYARARNLHACAKIVAREFAGKFPQSESLLRTLPGIGPYTAAAIAAIAFGAPAAAVDGNAERVVARLFAVETPLPAARAAIKALAKGLVPQSRPGDFAQAMMDLGATLCTPKNPACAACPISQFCLGLAAGCAGALPRKAPRPERPLRLGAVFYVAREDGAVLVRTRPSKGLLGGMTEFPGTPWDLDFDVDGALSQAPVTAAYRRLEHTVAHSFTHFSLRLAIFAAVVPAGTGAVNGCRFVPARDVDKEAFPSVMRKVLTEVRRGEAPTLPSRCARVLRGTRRVYE